jgi:hypothetical protein
LVQIFIVYGGPQGEEIGRAVQIYFKGNDIGAFLASPKSPDTDPSENFQARIDKELKTANLAVIIVTNGISSSTPALAEIDRIINELNYPRIPFVMKGVTPPSQLQGLRYVFFDHNPPTELELVELELRMWRYYDRWQQIRQVQQVSEGEKVEPKLASGLGSE